MSREEFLLVLEMSETEQKLAQLRIKREKTVDDDLWWMLERCRQVKIESLQKGENFCYALLRESGVKPDISAYRENFMRPKTPQKFGEGPIYIEWHIDSCSHILFITLWKE